MTEQQIVDALEERGIILRNGHFIYASRKHGRDYIDKNALLADTKLAGWLAHMIAVRALENERLPWPQVVAGPAMSGAILAQLVAQELRQFMSLAGDEPIYAVYAEKGPGDKEPIKLRRNYDKVVRGRTVLVVEDVVNTGGSALGTAHAVIEAGGIVTGVGVIWNRGEADKLILRQDGRTVEMPIAALVHRPFPSLTPERCKLEGPCAEGVPLNNDTGHGANFIELDKPRC